MITFQVNDMTCGHCASTITKAIKELDPTAKVEIDLHQHRVSVAVVSADAQSVGNAITEAGYTPELHEAKPADMPTECKHVSCCGGAIDSEQGCVLRSANSHKPFMRKCD